MVWRAYKAYVYGGYGGAFLKDTDEYNPDTWTSKTDIPSPARRYMTASTVSNKGYIYAGHDGSNRLQDTDEYDTDTWTSKSNMPSPGRRGLAASTISDKGYVYAGWDGSSYMRDTDEYDPDTWVSKSNTPSPGRYMHAASTIDDKGYIYGGDSSAYLSDTDEYDPDTWTSKSDIPSPGRKSLDASTISDKGYIYAGYIGSYLQDTDEYDPDSWTSKSNIPSPARQTLAASTVSDKGYVFGGSISGGALQDTDEYDPDTWVSKTDMPSPARFGFAASSIGYCLSSINTNQAYYDDPYVFNSSNDGLEIYDSSLDTNCAIAYILYDGGINCTTKIGESNLLLATTNSGIKSFNITNVSGTTDLPLDLTSYLSGYKSYPEITNNYVNYLHASGDYLCVATVSGVDHFNLGNSDSYDRSSTTVSAAIKCHQTGLGEFYYVFTDKVNAVYTHQCDWSDPDVGYTYDTTGSGILSASVQINDFYVVESNPNLLFFATTSGVVMIEENPGAENDSRYKKYFVEE